MQVERPQPDADPSEAADAPPSEAEAQGSEGTAGESAQHPAKDNEITDEDRENPMVNDGSFTDEGENRESSY